MSMDKVRVLRMIEYVGPRELVEEQLKRSLGDGTKVFNRGPAVEIRVATIGSYPEVLKEGDSSITYKALSVVLEELRLCQGMAVDDLAIRMEGIVRRLMDEGGSVEFKGGQASALSSGLRDLVTVINRMLEVIPETEKKLRERLLWHKTDYAYKAPEQRSQCWSGVADSLKTMVGEPDEEWKVKVQRIFNGVRSGVED